MTTVLGPRAASPEWAGVLRAYSRGAMGGLLLGVLVGGGITWGIFAELSGARGLTRGRIAAGIGVTCVAAALASGTGWYIFQQTDSTETVYEDCFQPDRGPEQCRELDPPVVRKHVNWWSGVTAGLMAYGVVGWLAAGLLDDRMSRTRKPRPPQPDSGPKYRPW